MKRMIRWQLDWEVKEFFQDKYSILPGHPNLSRNRVIKALRKAERCADYLTKEERKNLTNRGWVKDINTIKSLFDSRVRDGRDFIKLPGNKLVPFDPKKLARDVNSGNTPPSICVKYKDIVHQTGGKTRDACSILLGGRGNKFAKVDLIKYTDWGPGSSVDRLEKRIKARTLPLKAWKKLSRRRRNYYFDKFKGNGSIKKV